MFRPIILLALLIAMSMAACSSTPVPATTQTKPDADKLLRDLGIPTDFWQKSVVKNYKTKEGWDTWFLGADEAPKRLEDGECAGKDFTWIVAVNPTNGRGSLYSYDDANRNPDIGFLINNDASKSAMACDQIDRKDYFLVDDGIEPHQAITLIQELQNAVECVKQGQTKCGKWGKLEVNGYQDDFLKLPKLRVFAVDWEDRDMPDQMRVQYMLSPVSSDKRPYLHVLDCLVKVLPDSSLELDVAEGDYE